MLCSAVASSLEEISPSPLVSILLKALLIALERVDEAALVPLLDEEPDRALVTSDRLSEPSPSVSAEFITCDAMVEAEGWLCSCAEISAAKVLDAKVEDAEPVGGGPGGGPSDAEELAGLAVLLGKSCVSPEVADV